MSDEVKKGALPE